MSEFSIKRLRRALKSIKKNPEAWDQSNWATKTSCGTAYCMAGWVTHNEGLKEAGLTRDGDATGRLEDGREISTVATGLLGITLFESDRLFSGRNTLPDLERVAGEIASARGFTL